MLVGSLGCNNPSSPFRAAVRLEVVSGGEQTAPTGTKLPLAVKLRALNYAGDPVPGQLVRFEPDPGSGSVSATLVTTDETGLAFTFWTLGAQAGPATLNARAVTPPDPRSGAIAPRTIETTIVATAE
jgi:hypothetical protein